MTAPTICPAMSPVAYHAAEGLNFSSAKLLLDSGGPARYHYRTTTPSHLLTGALAIGQVAHALTLGVGADRLALIDAGDYRTKRARELRDAALDAGLTPVLEAQWDEASRIADAATQAAGDLLTGGDPEVAMFATHPTGVLLRGQADYVQPAGIVDIKTTSDATPRGMVRSVWRYRYYMQGAWYRWLYHACTGTRLPVYIVAVETTPPYLATVYPLADDYLTLGDEAMESAIALYTECSATGHWPGLQAESDPLQPPPWARDALAQAAADDLIAALSTLTQETTA